MAGSEAEAWRGLADGPEALPQVEQVQIISPLLAAEAPTLHNLRQAAALVHAPVLLVYFGDETSAAGVNDGAVFYWTLVGLFVVPGDTVGHCASYQGLLVDTHSGFILATVQGDATFEEDVLPGAVDVAAERVGRRARSDAFSALVANARRALRDLSGR